MKESTMNNILQRDVERNQSSWVDYVYLVEQGHLSSENVPMHRQRKPEPQLLSFNYVRI